jgi:hypothetical protein
MTKRIIFRLLFFITVSLNAQEKIIEPKFIGEAFIIKSDSTILKLEKEQVILKTKIGASVYLTGIGKIKTEISVPGCCSGLVYSPDNEIKLVVRAIDNETDPLSIIQVFKFQKKKKERLAELASIGTFSGGSSNNLIYLKFSADKYGEKSYILTIKEFERGAEYGVIVKNPNALDERQTIVSTFCIE